MRLSSLFLPTLKEDPKEATIKSHQLMLRAGFIRKLSSGLYSFLPLGFRVLNKIINIIREEMNSVNAQEFLMPTLIPKELWEESGRFEVLGDLMMKLKDRNQRDLILGPTHEEVFTDIVRNELRSYKQLPLNLYQIGTKYRDEIRPRFGLMRAREFIMKDAYSFHRDGECLDKTYKQMAKTYHKIFKRCGLTTVQVSADSGAMGGSGSEEFMVKSEIGEETIIVCSKCNYVANVEKAECYENYDDVSKSKEKLKNLELVDTPDVRTIEELTKFFNTTADVFIKTIVYVDEKNTPFIALIRGDLDINEVKLKNITLANEIFIADEEIIEKVTNAPRGFAGPVNLKNIKIIADTSIKTIVNGYTGANQKDKHYKNVNLDRDFKVDIFGDIRLVKEGDLCVNCKNPLQSFKGIELGHIFKLGDKYTKALNVTYLDENQQAKVPIMGTYGIGVSRIFACIVEQSNDENGVIFPMSIAPYHVIIVPIGKNGDETFQMAEKLYGELLNENIEVLIDDRDERAGVKFKDADLIGIPIRITIGKKALSENKVELKLRDKNEIDLVQIDKVIKKIKTIITGEIDKLK